MSRTIIFINFGKLLYLISSNILIHLLFLWNFYYVYVCVFDGAPQCLRLCSIIFIPFFFSWHFRVDKLIDLTLNLLVVSVACSYLLLNSYNECSISVIMLFSSKISVWFFIIIFLSLLIFSICWDVVLWLPFSFLSMVYFICLSIFKIIDLTSLLCKSNVYVTSGTVSVNPPPPFYFLWMGHTFLFLGMHLNVLLKTGHFECYDMKKTLEIRFYIVPEFFVYGLCRVVIICLITFLNFLGATLDFF